VSEIKNRVIRQPHLHAWLACLFLLGGLPLLLAACGFHLRGSVVLPPELKVIALQGTERNGELGIALRNRLNSAGGKIVDSPANASAILVISEDRHQRRVISVNDQGQADAYELIYRLGFQLERPDNSVWLPPVRITLRRQFNFDPANVLAKDDEEIRIVREMRMNAITQMLRRLKAGVLNNPSTSSDAPAS